MDFPYLKEIVQTTESKILMVVADGLGGLASGNIRQSELEAARIPNINRLAQHSACGLSTPVAPGITPGSGPGHLALFGYDPLKYLIGRGALEAMGIGLELKAGDLAARGNFATIDSKGNLIDRRAGRIPSDQAAPIAKRLNKVSVPGIEVTVEHVLDYRFVLRLRGENLSDKISETDPQITGVPPLKVEAMESNASATAQAVNMFTANAFKEIADESIANALLLRGWANAPSLPSFGDSLGLNPAAIAAYPMYRGLASIVGMKVIKTGPDFSSQVQTLNDCWDAHDYFFLHYKFTDSAGEDGDYSKKVTAIETLDSYIPELLELNPDVLILAGDHSTPAIMGAHSWHPVPFLIHSKWTHGEGVSRFNERELRQGSLGVFEAKYIMSHAMAHSGKLSKFGP
ncbi:MAG: phosphoglycerate mutase [Dehalococcoidia bacterium]|nr:phosphoglycerate mutase [Dehalococcoidia bacterium]